MKQFKRIIDRSGRPRYYIDGKQVTAKRGASEYVKRNFKDIQAEDLSRQELITFRNKERAIKAKSVLKESTNKRMRFKGRFLNKGLQNFLETVEFLPKGEYNISRELPDIRNYGDLLQEIKRIYPVNLKDTIFLDDTAWTTPNEKRSRTTYENVSDIVESMKKDFPNWDLVVKIPAYTDDQNKKHKARTVKGFIKAIQEVRKWENRTSKELKKEAKSKKRNLAFVKYAHNADLDIDTDTVTIDLNKTVISDDYS